MATGVGPRLRGVVLRGLVTRGVGAALRERKALDGERAALLEQLVPGPVTWDAAAPGPRADVRPRLAALDARRLVLSEALGRAFAEVATECPPFEVATRVEALVDLALREPSIGRAPCGAHDALAEEVVALAWRIADLWAPGFDPDAVATAFADRSIWTRAGRDLGHPREDARLGWAPIGPEEVLARAATSAAGQAFVALCASATREAAEADDVASQLEAARGEVSSLAAIVGRGLEERRRVDVLTHRLAQERHEAKAAFEAAWRAALRAAEVTPPLAVHGALLAASALLRGAGEVYAPAVRADGNVELARSPCGRALVLAALADVRAACDRAFPGLGILAGGGPGALHAFAVAERSPGPYRALHGATSSTDVPIEAGVTAGSEATLVSLLDGAGAPAVFARALGHGVARGTLEAGPERPGVAQRVLARSACAGDAISLRAARATWHRGALVDLRRVLVIGCARVELPRALVHEALLQIHLALDRLHPITVSDGPLLVASLRVAGQDEAVAAVDRLAASTSAVLGVPPDPWTIAEAVAGRLRGQPPVSAAIEALAQQLRETAFGRLVDELSRRGREVDDSLRAARHARQALPWIEHLNPFSSAQKRDADRASAAATQAEVELRRSMDVARDLFFRALGVYPLLALHVALSDVRATVRAIRGVGGGRYESAYLTGVEPAREMLRVWGGQAFVLLGGLDPAASVLERYAAAKLRAREGFTA